MRVRPHIQTPPGGELGGSHMIEKDERADKTACCGGKDPSDDKAAEVTRPGFYDGFDR
jgi:hypothetical protein